MTRRGKAAVAIWLVLTALAAFVALRARYVADMSAFLPAHPTELQQLLVDQLRDGPASRMILCAIEGGDAAARARLSAALTGELKDSPLFDSINNGQDLFAERDQQFLFEHRYVLSAAVDPQRFSQAGLHAAIERSLDEIASPAGAFLKPLLARDPTGEMLQILDQLQRTAAPRTLDEVWGSRDGQRALLVAATRAAGSDTDGQQRAMAAIQSAFDRALARDARFPSGALRLRMTGPGVFAVRARGHIETAAVRLSIASSALIVALLLLVYRSVAAVILGLLPVACGALAGVAAVAIGFGAVHGVTLGFGVTLIGESVDYSIYYFVHAHGRESPDRGRVDWQRSFWPTVRLGMLISVCGFASLLASGFPGLAQLGAFSIGGLIAAALVTRFVLPQVVPGGLAIRKLAPFGAGVALRLRRVPYPGALAGAALIGSMLVLFWHRDALWNRELAALSPISAVDQAFDAGLRADLGAADARDLVVIFGPDLQSVLRGAEQAGASLAPLIAANRIGGFDSPANFLPSLATQQMRLASLPDEAQLRSRLELATADLPLRAERLGPFLQDVAAARAAPAITPADLRGTSLAAGFAALVLREGSRWNALLALHPAAAGEDIDAAELREALRREPGASALVLDLKQESNALYSAYLAEAVRLSLGGFAAIAVLLAVALRGVVRAARVLAPLIVAVSCTAALLVAAGIGLTILHLVGLLLIVAVGSNYALFFERRRGADQEILPATIAAVAIANFATVIGFGLLSFSQVPVLEALGMTVAPGAFLALLFSALLAPRLRRPQDADA
jgi:predicted exporter